MIRKLSSGDYLKAMEYLKKEPEFNLFIIGDIENYGFEQDFVGTWAEFDEKGNIKAVLQKYFKSFVFYARKDFNVDGFFDIILRESNFEILSGKSDAVKRFNQVAEFNFFEERSLFFARLDGFKDLVIDETYEVKRATISDIERLLNLYKRIDEFSLTSTKESLSKNIQTGSGRYYYIEKDGSIISSAGTSAENSMSAMVVAVCTHPDYRQKGMATACVGKLCQDLINESKTVCLFYDNPKAAGIYKRLGFKDIGMWSMLKRKRNI